jgi:hypothetical protein
VSNRTQHPKQRASEIPAPLIRKTLCSVPGALARAGIGLEERKLPMKFSWAACQPHWE